jgi:hypothetical protein
MGHPLFVYAKNPLFVRTKQSLFVLAKNPLFVRTKQSLFVHAKHLFFVRSGHPFFVRAGHPIFLLTLGDEVVGIGVFDGELGLGLAFEVAPLVADVENDLVALGGDLRARAGFVLGDGLPLG